MIELIIWFLRIGAFSFGGGLATLPHIYEMARITKWCSEEDVTNLITLSQMTPGPLACNIATFVGNKILGVWGSIFAVISFIIPAIIFMAIFTKFIKKFENSKAFNIIISMVRATGYATIISGSLVVIKNALFYNSDQLKIFNCLQLLNIRAVIISILVYIISEKFKLSAIKTLGVGAIFGLIIQV